MVVINPYIPSWGKKLSPQTTLKDVKFADLPLLPSSDPWVAISINCEASA